MRVVQPLHCYSDIVVTDIVPAVPGFYRTLEASFPLSIYPDSKYGLIGLGHCTAGFVAR